MKKTYKACNAFTPKGEQLQIIGNNVQRFGKGKSNKVSCVGGTFFSDGEFPLKDLKYEDGVVLVDIEIETEPFDGYTNEVWIYGASKCARISSDKPYYCIDGNLYAKGDWWIDSWGDKEFFPERFGGIVKAYIRATISTETEETDYKH